MNFSKDASEIISFSRVIASNLGHSFLGTEHLLLSILGRKKSSGHMKKAADLYVIDYSSIMNDVVKLHGKGECGATIDDRLRISKNLEIILRESYWSALKHKRDSISEEDIFNSLLARKGSTAMKILENYKNSVNSNTKLFRIGARLDVEKIKTMRNETPILNSYCNDVTLAAAEGKLDPVVERDDEINEAIRILLRKNKNNPCLVGYPGVGKTSIVDGIAVRIVDGNVPEDLSCKRIVALDIAGIISGAKYRGDFEERLKGILLEVKKSRNVILMIDEIHNIVNTGSGEGTLDAANILKPELARGEISIIGATTVDEYSKTIEKDGALDRRFQKILIKEPDKDTTYKMLLGIKDKYADFHKIKIEDNSIKRAIELAEKILNKHYPDKAIDLIDECASLLKIENKKILTSEEIERFYNIKYNKAILNSSFLEEKINGELFGQEYAVKMIADTVSLYKSVFRTTTAPISMLFIGPSGVGKSFTAAIISKILFDNANMIKIDMGEYTEKHSVSKLIGSPPGYVGSEEKGLLISEIEKEPARVILFDEIEKAHSDVLKVLLNLLDDGIMRDGRGRSYNFGESIIIMTSCINSENQIKHTGFLESKINVAQHSIKKLLGNELYGRIDTVVSFEKADKEKGIELCKSLIDETKRLCGREGICVEVDDDVVNKIVAESEIGQLGYRGIKKLYAKMIESQIIKALRNSGKSKGEIRIYLNKGEITSFLGFNKLNLENNELSMYNIQKRID